MPILAIFEFSIITFLSFELTIFETSKYLLYTKYLPSNILKNTIKTHLILILAIVIDTFSVRTKIVQPTMIKGYLFVWIIHQSITWLIKHCFLRCKHTVWFSWLKDYFILRKLFFLNSIHVTNFCLFFWHNAIYSSIIIENTRIINK